MPSKKKSKHNKAKPNNVNIPNRQQLLPLAATHSGDIAIEQESTLPRYVICV